ncbi:MAG TPA: diguanylate cyclase [Methylomirabilota bacterium]|nr:diguanylate cyclase [Methylomirabilota bacterium]
MALSISTRLRILCALAIAGMLLLGGPLGWVLLQQRGSQAWVGHAQQVETAVADIVSGLTDLEAGERGFLITADDHLLGPYNAALQDLPARIGSLKDLVKGDLAQTQRTERLEDLVNAKIQVARSLVAARRQAEAAPTAGTDLDRGNELMDNVRRVAAAMVALEQDGLAKRQAALAETERDTFAGIALVGPIVAILLLMLTYRTIRRFKRPLDEIVEGTQRIANGDLAQEIPAAGDNELGVLARSFNDMVKHMRAEQAQRSMVGSELRQAYKDLTQRTQEVEARGRTIDLLGRMAHRLQSCSSEDELTEVVRRFAGLILPEVPGALFLLNNSRNMLRAVAQWHEPKALREEFHPQDCWALRRGQPHAFEADEAEVVCGHVVSESGVHYRCFPMMAQGETLGLLYVEEPTTEDAERLADARAALADKHRVEIMVENIALALGNLRLREALRNQSIRDPLTGLFNRRYLDESFTLEVARAGRARSPIAVLMIDVDHFKRFNDTFGHDAGDAVLKSVGEVLAANVRRGDIACRFGGEEFTIIAPGASAEDAGRRAEALRAAVSAIRVIHQGRPLGPITCSIGVASFPAHGSEPAEIIQAADAALYRAKQEGRNRVELAPPRAQLAAVATDRTA